MPSRLQKFVKFTRNQFLTEPSLCMHDVDTVTRLIRARDISYPSTPEGTRLALLGWGQHGDGSDGSIFWEYFREPQKLVGSNNRDIRAFFDSARQYVCTNTQYVGPPEAWTDMIQRRCAYPSRAHSIVTAVVSTVLAETEAYRVGPQVRDTTPLEKAQFVIKRMEECLNKV